MAEALAERAERVYEKYGTVMVNLEGMSQVGAGWARPPRALPCTLDACRQPDTAGWTPFRRRRHLSQAGAGQGFCRCPAVAAVALMAQGPEGASSGRCCHPLARLPATRALAGTQAHTARRLCAPLQAGIERKAAARNLFIKLLSLTEARALLSVEAAAKVDLSRIFGVTPRDILTLRSGYSAEAEGGDAEGEEEEE